QMPPMLARLGPYRFNVQQPLIDGTWAYWQTGQWGNQSRRMPDLYPQTPPQNTAEKAAFDQAIQAIATAPFLPDLAVLDRDQELQAWYGNYIDFHPRTGFCSLDPNLVRSRYIANPVGLFTRIANVPQRMAKTFLSMYQAELKA